MEVWQKTVVRVEPPDLLSLDVSVPWWDQILEAPANLGIVRHGGVKQAQANVAGALKPRYDEHAAPFLEGGRPHLLIWGTRNSGQNLLLPLYDARRSRPLLGRVDEPWRTCSYFAFVQYEDGTRAMEQVRFEERADGRPLLLVRQGKDTWSSLPVEWAVSGQPLVWDGEIPSQDLVAGLTYDLRHLYRIPWEAHQHCESAARAHSEMMGAFMSHLDSPAAERGRVVRRMAESFGFQEETAYLHSSLGLDDQGALVLICRHASLRTLGETHLGLGARRAILLDNGGSVGYAFFSDGRAAATYVGNGTYFRPRGHAVFVAALAQAYRDAHFRG